MKRLLVWGDIHTPKHSVKATDEALRFAKDYRPHIFVQVGDYRDAESVSSHDRDPSRPLRMVDEMRECESFDARVDRVMGNAEKYITEGNHCDRLRRYIWKNAPALDGLVDMNDVFGFRRRGFKVTRYGQVLKIGKVHFTHDLGKSGAGAARHAMQTVQGNIVIGHTHRAEVVYENNPRGKPHFGCAAGWLGDPDAINYRHSALVKRDWMHSYVTLDMEKDGGARLQLHPIL